MVYRYGCKHLNYLLAVRLPDLKDAYLIKFENGFFQTTNQLIAEAIEKSSAFEEGIVYECDIPPVVKGKKVIHGTVSLKEITDEENDIDNPYACPICNMKFKNMSAVRMHTWRVHGKKGIGDET